MRSSVSVPSSVSLILLGTRADAEHVSAETSVTDLLQGLLPGLVGIRRGSEGTNRPPVVSDDVSNWAMYQGDVSNRRCIKLAMRPPATGV